MNVHEPTILFLCGVGRSGTTVLRTSLGTHHQIYYNGFENNIVQDLVGVALKNCTMPSRKKSMAVDQAKYDMCFRGLMSELLWPDEELAKRPVHMAAINPDSGQLDFMKQVFPGSKYVSLIRNGIEVVSSRMEYDSFAANKFESHCEVWNRSVEVCHWAVKNPSDSLVVRQEWFYQPEKLKQWSQEFSELISVDYSETPEEKILGTLRHPTSANFTIEQEEFAGSALEEKQKYFRSKRDRWKQWTDDQREQFEQLCAENMTMLGYEIPWSVRQS